MGTLEDMRDPRGADPSVFDHLPPGAGLAAWVEAALAAMGAQPRHRRRQVKVRLDRELARAHGVDPFALERELGVWSVRVCTLRAADVMQVESPRSTVQVHVPGPDAALDGAGAQVYHRRRRADEHPAEAQAAAVRAATFADAEREVYLTLLTDGVPWQEAADVAARVVKPS